MNDGAFPLRVHLEALEEALREDLEALQDLEPLRRRQPFLRHLLEDLARQRERAEGAGVLTLVGPTGAGKSTLLNALTGREIAAVGLERPTTREPVVHAPRDAGLGRLLADLPGPPPRILRQDEEDGPWDRQILVDAPDLNSVESAHRRTVEALALRSDVLVVVLHRQAVVEEASVAFLDDWLGRRNALLVLNRADELSEEAARALLAQLRELAQHRWGLAPEACLLLSAREAREGRGGETWEAFRGELLARLQGPRLARVRLWNALGTLRRLEKLLQEAAREFEAGASALLEEVRQGAVDLAHRWAVEVRERLRLRRAEVQELLCAEAARRWDGPGGWALRAGGLAAVGAGAGALLLRRNPWLAAGAAAGGIAARKGQEVLRRHRLGRSGPVLPGGEQRRIWGGESLLEARLRAARLTADPLKLGLPAPEEVDGRLARAVEEGWSGLLERELPRAAEGRLLRALHLPLDLPVWALLLLVVAQAAASLFGLELPAPFQARVTGLDALVDLALVAGAWLLLVRLGVRRALAARSFGLLQRTGQEIEAGLEAAAQGLAEAAGAEVEDRRRRFARLARLEETWRERLEEAAAGPPVRRSSRG